MTPRRASLRVAHRGNCPHVSKTSLDSLQKMKGCTCADPEWDETKEPPKGVAKCAGCTCSKLKPTPKTSYYVMWRDEGGKTHKSARVTDRGEADKALRAKQVEIDQGRAGTEPLKNMAFPKWVHEYLKKVEGTVRTTTYDTYKRTLDLAAEAIGHKAVRSLDADDFDRFHLKIKHSSPATQIKHYTQLGGCIARAVRSKVADAEVVTALQEYRYDLKLRAAEGTPPFTDGEVAKILSALANEAPVYQEIVRAALTCGARIGELVALEWPQVDLGARRIRIAYTYTPRNGRTAPKNHKPRDVYLSDAALKVFADVIARVDVQTEGLVFPAPGRAWRREPDQQQDPRSGGPINAGFLAKKITKAMADNGIPTIDPDSSRPRKPSHSLRATYSTRALEEGRNPLFIQRQLGHSKLDLTVKVYGQWSDERMREEATRDPNGNGG